MDLADPAAASASAEQLLSRTVVLEPSDGELELAAAIETAAQTRGLALDAGESQLVAITIQRAIPWIETGDKRAIKSLEVLVDEVDDLTPICGRVRCLEQIVLGCADQVEEQAMGDGRRGMP